VSSVMCPSQRSPPSSEGSCRGDVATGYALRDAHVMSDWTGRRAGFGKRARQLLSDPVVEVAMEHLTAWVYPRRRSTDYAPLVLVVALGKLMALVLPGNRYTGRQRHDLRHYLQEQRRLRLQKGLSNPSHRAGAIHAFKHLKYNGCHFDAAELRVWALAHGWTADDAQQLGDYAEGVLVGTRYHTPPDPWGRHAINRWREEAARR
jgi:hypothetical protein